MSFPTSPTNGQLAVINNITYSYSTSTTAWTRVAGNVTATTYLSITNNTQSSSTLTGALIVTGGAGIGGNLYVGGTLYATISGSITTATNITGGTAGQVPYQTAPGITSFYGPGTAGQILISGGTSAPTYTNTGTIQVGYAANILAGTAGQLVYQTGANATGFVGPGTTGQILVATTGAAPVYTNTGSIYVGYANQSNNIIGGGAGQITYQTAAGTTGFVSSGTAGQILVSGAGSGSGTPVFTNTSSIYVGFASTSTYAGNIGGGTAGQLVYQTGGSATGFVGPGTTGQLLVATTGAAPTYTNTSSIYVQDANVSTNIRGGAAGQLTYQTAVGTTGFVSSGTAGQILVSGAGSGLGTPVFTSTGSIYVGYANESNNLLGGANGSLPYQTASGATTFLPIGTTGYVLTVSGGVPTWAGLSGLSAGNATTATNLAAGTVNQIPYQTAAGATSFFGPGTAGQILVSNGTTAGGPVFTNTGSIYVGYANAANNIIGGGAGQITYQTAAGTTGFISSGTAGQILVSGAGSGTGTPVWLNTGSFYAGSASTSTYAGNIGGGTAGQLVYQTGGSATGFVGPGTAGQILISNGAAAPVYTSTGSVYVGYANKANNIIGGAANQIPYQSGTDATTFNSNFTFNGNSLSITSGAFSTSTGANNSLYVTGGSWFSTATFSGPVTFNQTVTFSGTATYVYSTNTVYTDNIIELHVPPGGIGSQWQSDDGKDIGLRFHYYANSTDTNAALVLADDTKYLEWYQTGSENLAGDFTGPSSYGVIKAGIMFANSNTNATAVPSGGQFITANAGAIQTLGGIGVAQDIYAGGKVTATGFYGNVYANNTTTMYVGFANESNNLLGGANGSLPYQSGSGATTFLPIGTNGYVLTVVSGLPAWSAAGSFTAGNATTATNLAGGTAGQTPYQTSPGNTSFYGPGTAGQLLVSGGTSGPTYTNTGSIYVGFASTSTYAGNIGGGTAGQLVYQTGGSATGFVGPGTTGQLLVATTGAAPAYTNTSSIYVQDANVSTNIRGGSAGQLTYQTAAGTTGFISSGTAGQILISGAGSGTGSPVFTSTGSVYVGYSNQSNNIIGGTTGALVYQSAANTTGFISAGTTGQLLVAVTGAAPTYTNTGSIYVGYANAANNLLGGTTGQFVYQSAANTTAFISTGSMYVGYANAANNIIGGGAGQITYQTAAGTTGFISSGTAGQILVSGAGSGSGTPVFTSTGSIYVNRSTLADSVPSSGITSTGTLYAGFANEANNLLGGANGSLPYQTASGATTFLPIGTNGYVLTVASGIPAWSSISGLSAGNATTATNLAAGTVNQIPYQTAAGSTGFFGPGSIGQILVSNGTTAGGPVFTNTTTIQVGYAANILAGTAGQLVYQSAANTTGFVGPGTTGQLLVAVTGAAPTYTNTGSIYVGYANQSNNIVGGAAGQLTYQTAVGTTGFVSSGTAGQILISGAGSGTGTPVWQNTATTFVGNAVTATNIAGGVINDIPYQTAPGVTGFSANLIFDGTVLTVTKIIVSQTTAATSTSTGALQVQGGVGIGGSLFVGGSTYVAGDLYVDGTQFIVNTNNIATGDKALVLSTGSTTALLSSGAGIYVGATSATSYASFSYDGTTNWTVGGTTANTIKTPFLNLTGNTGYLYANGGSTVTSSLTIPASAIGNTSTMAVGFSVNLLGGAAGSLPYQTGANATTFLSAGSVGQFLRYGSSNAPIWSSTATFSGGTASTASVSLQSLAVTSGGIGVTGDSIISGNLHLTSNLYVDGNITGGGVRYTTAASTATITPWPPTVGDYWYDTANDVNYKWSYDGSNYFWLDVTGPTVANAAVGTQFTAKASGIVGAATDITFGNLKARIPSSGNRSLQLSTVSGSYTFVGSSQSVVNGTSASTNVASGAYNTSPSYVNSSLNLTTAGDIQIVYVTDITNVVSYRITLILGSASFTNNVISIEQLV